MKTPLLPSAILGVSLDAVDKAAYGSWFCQDCGDALSKTAKRRKNVLIFYVQHKTGGGTAPFNVIIVADQNDPSSSGAGWATPIMIDPKLKNDG